MENVFLGGLSDAFQRRGGLRFSFLLANEEANLIARELSCDISLGNHPTEVAFIVDDRNAPNLIFFHQIQALFQTG